MNIHITSDIHLDFWINPRTPIEKQKRLITELVENTMPDIPAKVVLIAGDIGHYNWQNELYFKELRKHYDHVLWVFGNHDLYMVSSNVTKAFNNDSWIRLDDMIKRSNSIEGVHYLEGNIINIDGIKFGGHGMWYDGSYAKTHHYLNDIGQMKAWRNMNDSVHITDQHTTSGFVDWKERSVNAIEAVKDIVTECDVFMSHVGPDDSHILPKWRGPMTGFYYFNGDELLSTMNENQAWIYGHTHDPVMFNNTHGCTMICNPLGYPYGDSRDNLYDAKERKFLVYAVGVKLDYNEIFKGLDNE